MCASTSEHGGVLDVQEHCIREIRATIATCITDRSLLRGQYEACRIADVFGISSDRIYSELIEAGIRAGVDIEFGEQH
jgi:hypothetical protein